MERFNPNIINKPFANYFLGIASLLSTLIWFFFLFWGSRLATSSTQEFLSLHQNPLLVVKYAISYACFVFSIIALTGLYIRVKHQHPGLSLLALNFYILGASTDFVYRAIEGITMHFIWAKNYLTVTDEVLKAEYLSKIDLFNEFGESIYIVFGTFFTVSWALFGICAWKVHKILSSLSLLTAIFIATLYSASFFLMSITPAAWVLYEIISIAFYIILGLWLIKDEAI